MRMTKEDVLNALKTVQDPELRRDIVALGAVKKAAACDGHVGVTLALPSRDRATLKQLRDDAEIAIRAAASRMGESLKGVQVDIEGQPAPAPAPAPAPGTAPAPGSGPGAPRADQRGTPQESATGLPGVAQVIAVGAGKGGVGKSTISVNLAVALARSGKAVGLMDGDIYGPSAPTLMGLDEFETHTVGSMLQPFYVHGVKTMTIGKLVDPEKPLIWRGPMAHGAFKQLVEQTQWGELDYLIIDLPPGTGDVPLTMAQLLRLTGAVIVCTPQKVAQDDAVRALRMFQQLGVDVLGVVENMSYFIGDDGKEYDLFGRGGAEQMAQRLGAPFLGSVPISMALRQNSDSGQPVKNFEGDARLRDSLEALARQLENQVALAGMRNEHARPSLTIH